MTPNEYQHLALKTERTRTFINPEQYRDHIDPEMYAHMQSRLLHGMLGVCTEAGELQDVIKKHLIYGKPIDLTNVMEECGDVLWYLALILHATGFTMEEAMERNIAKLKARFPDGFTEEKALNRNLDAEADALKP